VSGITFPSPHYIVAVTAHFIRKGVDFNKSRVSFYDDSLLRPLSSRTEHFRLTVHHCRNSSVLSLLFTLYSLSSSLPVCMCFFFFYFSAVLSGFCGFSTHDIHQKERKVEKNQKRWRHIASWCLLNHGPGLLQQNKKWFDWYFFQLSV